MLNMWTTRFVTRTRFFFGLGLADSDSDSGDSDLTTWTRTQHWYQHKKNVKQTVCMALS